MSEAGSRPSPYIPVRRLVATYFSVIALVNAFFGWALAPGTQGMLLHYREVFVGMQLPAVTILSLTISSWPYVFAGLSVAGVVTSLYIPIRRVNCLYHVIVLLLLLEVLVAFVIVSGHILPFVPLRT